jgi:two-component system, response regulator PdtaR
MVMPARTEREDLAGARVLVVEDEFLIALEVEFLLRDFGCEVLGPVPSIAWALELLGRERPDAALLDLNLLDGVAVPVAELLASMGVPFVLVTAYAPSQIEAPSLRGVPHLGKPVGHDALQRMLVALLDVPRAARDGA